MFRSFAFVSAAALALSACGGGNEPPAADQTSGPGAEETPLAAAPSAEAGEALFVRCMSCHRVGPGQNGVGPTMAGVVGRDVASVPGFNYSPAMRELGGSWTPERLSQLIENPRAMVPGTRMVFAGMPDAQNRADLIAYLETL